MELYFDILSDLSDDLDISDYFEFLLMNDTTYMIRYDLSGIVRRAEYYHDTFDGLVWTYVSSYVCAKGDLEVLKWFKKHKEDHYDAVHIFSACRNGQLDVIKWLYDNVDPIWRDWVNIMIFEAERNGFFEVVEFLMKIKMTNQYPEGITEIINMCEN